MTAPDYSKIRLKDGERIDDLQRNHLGIIQDPGRFCFGMDAVLLSGFAKDGIRPGAKVMDLGTGTGIIPILLAAKTEAEHLTGLEIQEESADMARRSVLMDGLEERIDIKVGDIKEASKLFAPESFDAVTSNPPYMIASHGLVCPEDAKAIARHEVLVNFREVAEAAEKLLKTGGHFYLVHRPFRMAEIFVTLHELGLEPKRLKMVHPFADKEPNMFLLDAVKGARSRLTVEKPLIVYKEKNVYTDEIYDIYGY